MHSCFIFNYHSKAPPPAKGPWPYTYTLSLTTFCSLVLSHHIFSQPVFQIVERTQELYPVTLGYNLSSNFMPLGMSPSWAIFLSKEASVTAPSSWDCGENDRRKYSSNAISGGLIACSLPPGMTEGFIWLWDTILASWSSGLAVFPETSHPQLTLLVSRLCWNQWV